jgi:hypothetical protein
MSKPGLVTVRPAGTQADLAAALRLRYECYLREGYVPPNASGLLSDAWDALSGTLHLVAVLGERGVVGAVRLVQDSDRGLPMEREFTAEVKALREEGRKLAEASALVVACRSGYLSRGVWLELCRALWRETLGRGIDDLCAGVTRAHLGFYRRLGFEQTGQPAPYRSLSDVLAYPLRLRVGVACCGTGPDDNARCVSLREYLRQNAPSE